MALEWFTSMLADSSEVAGIPGFRFMSPPGPDEEMWGYDIEAHIHQRMFEPENTPPGLNPVPPEFWLTGIRATLTQQAPFTERTDLYESPQNPDGLSPTKWKATEATYATDVYFEMQGDLYLQFELDQRWRLLLDKGLYDNFELMAIGHILSNTGYIKIGHFVPPFGMRQSDHTAFVRERIGFGTEFRETGIEIGFHPERINAAFSVTNGSSAEIDPD